MSEGGGRGCVKVGCIGCLTVIGLVVGMVFLFGAVQLTTDWGDPTPQTTESVQDLPTPPSLPELTEFPGTETPNTALAPLPSDLGPAPSVAGGRLVIDLAVGEFSIEPGPENQPIRVEADYDSNAFSMEESYTEREDGAWVYEVTSKLKGGWIGAMMRGGVRDGDHRVKIIVPRGQPLEIVGKVGMGESEIDLGGLWVQAVDLELSTGDHFLEFSEPTPFPVERLVLEASMGALEVRDVGNASPLVVKVDHSMGELLVDLEGPWRNDSEITVGFGMGECKLWLPQDVKVDVARASVSMGERDLDIATGDDLPADAMTLTLDLRGSMGELSVKQ